MKQGTLTAIEKVIFLKSVDIFKHATVEELGGVAALTEEVHFQPGRRSIARANLLMRFILF
jgi:hypothetical protein